MKPLRSPSIALLCAALAAVVVAAPRSAHAQPAAPAHATQELVVSANPYASDAGLAILREGGGAVDAAIAVQLVLTLVEPQSSGVGGGAFLLFYAPPAKGGAAAITAYEGRETAPAAATPDMFLTASGRPDSFGNVGVGGLAVGVPGVMRMLELAHRDHGRLPWAKLFEPAIALAESGFDVSPRLYQLLNGFKRFARADDFRRYFYEANGEPHPIGYRLKNPEYAAALRELAAKGVEPLYTGDLAAAIAAKVQSNNVRAGRLTAADLAKYRAHATRPLCTAYRSWQVCGPQLPSSGGVTTQEVLGILGAFDLAKLRNDPAESIHLFVEANRLAFADRNLYLGDPEFVPSLVAELLSPAYLRERAALIDPKKALPSVTAGVPRAGLAWQFAPGESAERPSTSHFSIADKFGDAVAMTTSVQGAFGSQLMVGGFILNNELTDFEYAPEADGKPVANRIEGGKHPLSSMAPTMLLDAQGRLRLLVGSPGGTRIIGFVAQSVVGYVDWKLNAQQAVAAPHFLAETGPVELEEGTDVVAQRAALEALGHTVALRNLNSGLHAIAIDYTDRGRVLAAGVDPRREGAARGD
jgi:gamma-glutamyltranspeptidase/glutathione hydrolase